MQVAVVRVELVPEEFHCAISLKSAGIENAMEKNTARTGKKNDKEYIILDT